jgi:glycerol-3-phosphate dehydrogenase
MREIKQIAIIGMGKWGKNLIREFAKFSKHLTF